MGLGFRGLGFRGLGFSGLGLRLCRVSGIKLKAMMYDHAGMFKDSGHEPPLDHGVTSNAQPVHMGVLTVKLGDHAL